MLFGTAAMADTTDPMVARGRYLVEIGGCNDCHSPGYAESNGQLPEQAWLQGSAVGFSGPWGVSYPGNLRRLVDGVNEEVWLQRIQAGGLPPMPWKALQTMTEDDRVAIFRYVRTLGPAGEWPPAAQPPGVPIRTQHISFVPLEPDQTVAQTSR